MYSMVELNGIPIYGNDLQLLKQEYCSMLQEKYEMAKKPKGKLNFINFLNLSYALRLFTHEKIFSIF
jgi:hypothetical protein